jgi:flagellar biosynthesis protein FlhG
MGMDGRRNYYDILGIERTATLPQVERAYRFCLEMYGDNALATYSLLQPGEQQEARESVREAYEVLRDPARRRAYDLSLAQPVFKRELPVPAPPPPAPSPLAVVPLPPVTFPSLEPTPNVNVSVNVPVPVAAPVPVPVPEAVPVPPAPLPATGPVALGEPVSGAALRRFREGKGVSLDEIAQKSKISVRFLRYIEDERFDMLPAAVYLRGFLHEYARGVGLEPRGTAEGYLQRVPSL